MAEWKKVIVSGSQAELNNIEVDLAVTASYFKGDGSALTNIVATTLDIDNFGTDHTAITIADGDKFAVSDGGTEGRVNASQISSYVLGNLTRGIANDNVVEMDDADAASGDFARFTANGLEGRSASEVRADLSLEVGTDVLAQQTIGIANDNLLEVDDAAAASGEFARFTANGLEGRSAAQVKADLSLEVGTDVLAQQTIGIADDNLLEVDDASAASGEFARFTANGLEGRSASQVKADLNLEIGTDVLAQQSIGIANDNLVEMDDADAASGDFARFTANGLEGRSAAEVRADLSLEVGTDVLAQQTIGIADDNLLEVDDASAASGEFARFTANGLEGRSASQVKADLNLEIGTDVLAQQTIGIADDNLLEVDDASAASGEFARFTANGIEGRSASQVRADLDLEVGTDVLAQQTIGIANDNLVEMDDADAASGDFARFTANGLEGRSAAEVRDDLSLDTDDDVTFANLTLTGNLTVEGSQTNLNVTDLDIEDRFILLNSGSSTRQSTGIIFGGADAVAQSGSAIIWDATYNSNDGRLRIANSVGSTDTTVVANYSIAGVFEGTAANAATAQADHVGNIRVESSDIYIYV